MWTEPRIDNLLLTIVPHQSRMFRSSAVPWALQLTCGQSIMISLSQLPPAQSLSAVAVTLYARALIVKRAGIVRLCPTLHWRMKPKEWPWYGLWSIFDLNVLQRPEASCFIIVWRTRIVRLFPTLHWSLYYDLDKYGLWSIFNLNVLQHPEASCCIIVWRARIVRLFPTLHWRMKPKEWPWYGLWSIFGLNVLQHPEASCFIIVWRACALWVFVLLCTEAYRMTLVWPLEHLWLERLAASRSVLFHHSMACSRIERLCLTLHRSLKNDLGMAFGASLVWTSCSIRKRLVSSLYGARAHCIVRLCLTLHWTWVARKPKIQPAFEWSLKRPCLSILHTWIVRR